MKIKKLVAINIATGISFALISNLIFAKEQEDIGTIIINDKTTTIKQRDQKGYDAQYDKNESNVYLGKELVERYKGTNPADVLNSAVGVFSGDARNSGAIDPNVRGIQGQGRVPVTVDGTEQAHTVWRGYNGANNRNYVDPNMISSITVHKSASLDPDVKTSVGGGIAIRTINIDDVVSPEDTFGFDLKLETSSNSTKPRIAQLQTGTDYRDDPAILKSMSDELIKRTSSLFNDPALLMTAKSRGDANFFNLRDNAVRMAIGTRQERFDAMAAYSYRDQGNYFAGTRGAENYTEEILTSQSKSFDPYMPFAANVYFPGREVMNTSSKMDTYLIKTNLFLSEQQKLSLGYTQTMNHYGEIMPSRVAMMDLNGKVPQWPLAKFKVDAFYATYSFLPENNPYIDMKLGYWLTKTISNSNTSGAYPREPRNRDLEFERGFLPRDSKIDGTLVLGEQFSSLNHRQGIDLSNKMQLTNSLELTIIGSLTHETINSKNNVFDASAGATVKSFGALPREGKRQENTFAFNFNWRPTNWLNMTAGAQRTSYWSQDDLLNKRRALKDINFARPHQLVAKNYDIFRVATVDEYNKIINHIYIDSKGKHKRFDDVRRSPYYRDLFIKDALNLNGNTFGGLKSKKINGQEVFRIRENSKAKWYPDSDNKLTKETNPFYNGTFDLNAEVIDPFSGQLVPQYIPSYSLSSNNDETIRLLTDEEKFTPQEKRKAHAWAPAFSASAYLTDNDRIYASYTETVRMPSIFEDTIGFSSIIGNTAVWRNFQPERGKTAELGYVRNLQQLLGAEHFADVRINYYYTTIENSFERDGHLKFTQVDKHITSGIELQARYDNGNYFGDIGIDYRLKNEVCDSASAAMLDPMNKFNISSCTEAGFPGGFMRTQLQPKYSINANLGMRFFDQRLEVGSRMRYHSGAENSDEKEMMGKYPAHYAPLNNSPMRWNPVFVADAYMSYQIAKDISMELLATNVFDEYYLDPLTRTMMPAPGRTFRLNFTSHF
ncbi:TonB-dependent receptor domain-containing protein [Providencia manganoxydans]|uniref:TonB-dependent receptor domain-containing protein n=1 Tax=Providencia manganoxydans TaxID=2923283 RepID=UPI0032D9EFB1